MEFLSLTQLLGNLGEFIGAIAVVVTLLYLAAQVRHSKVATEANTKAIELQSYQSWQAANLQMNVGILNCPFGMEMAAGLSDSRKLTPE